MRIVIAGGHGKIALILERLLSARGDSVVGLIRNPAQVADLEAAGAEAVVVDLEEASIAEVAQHVRGADAVVFAAGAGPGSGAARKETVDRDAAILLADAALEAGVNRYLIVSSIGADKRADDPGTDPVFAAYLRAKAAADRAVQARTGLSATIVRPGHLTDEAGMGRVAIAESTGLGSIPRADVAAVLVAVLDSPDTGGHAFDLISGDTTIADAVEAIAAVVH
ncbi:NAD-dependent epimerase/dehydratase family protein [Mycolicibacterium sp. P9-64]|uniref:NAD(P)H-binding protein n=1 Tax=Mycolicibacterium sp. P9-64 TaxID=2024612 RepID=UPI0011EBBB42|nr:NAD(P)H-binding protein [Mycolicibacterium sp. P9-64]KAA0086565.1 NAD-dependent epimerase/dehydratase family protein [Mycolicibacterium sp. P9-64]